MTEVLLVEHWRAKYSPRTQRERKERKKKRTRVLDPGKNGEKDNIDYRVAVQIMPYQKGLGAVFSDYGCSGRVLQIDEPGFRSGEICGLCRFLQFPPRTVLRWHQSV